MTLVDVIEFQLEKIKEEVIAAAHSCERNENDISILAVSKMQSVEKMRALYALGVRDFGENYVQELVQKRTALQDLQDIRWHFIGHLQTNKIKLLKTVHKIHTVDSLKLLKSLDKFYKQEGARQKILMQVKLDQNATEKTGADWMEVQSMLEHIHQFTSVEMCGFMAIGPQQSDVSRLKSLYLDFVKTGLSYWKPIMGTQRCEFSLGMSSDFELAIACGSTCIRVGSSLFGPRGS